MGPSLLPALALHHSLGPARKAARLRYLTTYWRTRVAAARPDARFYTPDEEAMSCGLCTVEVPGVEASAIQRRLREHDGILVQAMGGSQRTPDIRGVRVSPNVYTTPSELDRFVAALLAAASG